jgi:hypothetical protein
LHDEDENDAGPGRGDYRRTSLFHRGSNFGAPGRSRFAILTDFQVRGPSWAGKMSWPNGAKSPHWVTFIERATVRERDLFGFPKPGDPYWNEQTLHDVGRRYPNMDMTPYLGSYGTEFICAQNISATRTDE